MLNLTDGKEKLIVHLIFEPPISKNQIFFDREQIIFVVQNMYNFKIFLRKIVDIFCVYVAKMQK